MEETSSKKETEFHKWFIANPNKGFSVIGTEFVLLGAKKLLERGSYELDSTTSRGYPIGRIDLIIKYKNTTYITEIKYTNSSYDFWSATKVLAYTEYYKWQTENKTVKPAIMMPMDSIKLEHNIVAGKLKIKLFGIEKTGNAYNIKIVN